MKYNLALQRQWNNIRDGYHVLSRYWQEAKIQLPELTQYQKDVCIGITLGDASITKQNAHASIKVEQGSAQLSLVKNVFNILASHCFMTTPNVRMDTKQVGKIKSYWFKTWAIPQFTVLWNMLYVNGIKTIQPSFILEHVSPVALAYWIMCDGSRDGNIITLHTQGFSFVENEIISRELNERYGFSTQVKSHKKYYYVINFSSEDRILLRNLIGEHMLPDFGYKM